MQVDTDTTLRVARDDTDYVYAWNGTTDYRYQLSVLLDGIATEAYVDSAIAGLGTMATQDDSAVAITGGTIDGVTIGTSTLSITNNLQLFDGAFQLKDNGDITKVAQFECSTIGTGTTRTFTFPNASGTIALAADLSGYQPLDSDLTTISGLTPTTDNFLQAKSSAWASRTPAQVAVDLQGTGLTVDMVGFRGIPQNSQSAAYTTVAADAGKHIHHPSTDANARTFTIDSNANVPYPIGTAITFTNRTSNVVTIAITSDTMYLAGTTMTGSRSLAENGMATALKVNTTTWIISGAGLS